MHMWSSKELDLSFLDLSMNYYTFINFSLFKELKKREKTTKDRDFANGTVTARVLITLIRIN